MSVSIVLKYTYRNYVKGTLLWLRNMELADFGRGIVKVR